MGGVGVPMAATRTSARKGSDDAMNQAIELKRHSVLRDRTNLGPINFVGSAVDYLGGNGYEESGFDSGEGA